MKLHCIILANIICKLGISSYIHSELFMLLFMLLLLLLLLFMHLLLVVVISSWQATTQIVVVTTICIGYTLRPRALSATTSGIFSVYTAN